MRDPRAEPPRWSRRDLWLTLGLVALAILWFLSYWRYNVSLTDEAHLVHQAGRLLEGEVPYRDFHSIYAPGRHLLAAFIFLFTGPSLLAVHAQHLVLRALSVGLAYALGRQVMRPLGALVPAVLLLLVPGAWHKVYYTLFSLLGLLVLTWFYRRPRVATAVGLGVTVSLACQFRQDVGVMLGILSLVLLLIHGARGSRLRHLGAYLGSGVLTAGPLLVYLTISGALVDMVWLLTLPVRTDSPRWEIPRSMLTLGADRGAMAGRGMISALTLVLLFTLIFVFLRCLWLLLRSRRMATRDALLFFIALIGLIGANQMFRYDPAARLLQCGGPAYLLLAAIFTESALGLGRIGRLGLLVPWGFTGLLGWQIWTVGPEMKLGLEYTGSAAVRWIEERQPLEVRGETVYVPPAVGTTLQITRDVILNYTGDRKTLFVLGTDPLFYHWTGLRNPTRFAWVTRANWKHVRVRHWEETLERLRRHRPPVILVRHFLVGQTYGFREHWGKQILDGYHPIRTIGRWAVYLENRPDPADREVPPPEFPEPGR